MSQCGIIVVSLFGLVVLLVGSIYKRLGYHYYYHHHSHRLRRRNTEISRSRQFLQTTKHSAQHNQRATQRFQESSALRSGLRCKCAAMLQQFQVHLTPPVRQLSFWATCLRLLARNLSRNRAQSVQLVCDLQVARLAFH